MHTSKIIRSTRLTQAEWRHKQAWRLEIMRGYIIGFCILVLSGTCLIGHPRCLQAKKHQLVIEPSDTALLLVASQPNCPLRIENVRRLLNVDVSWDARYEYQLRNRGR